MKFKKSLASVLSTAMVVPAACNTVIFANSESTGQSDLKNSSSKTQYFSEDLKKLIKLGFTVNGKKISEKDSLNRIKLDLFEGDNLNIALVNGVKFILNDETSRYIDSKDDIVNPVRGNTLICECLQSTLSYAEKSEVAEKDKNFELFKRLHTIELMMENDQNISKENQAFKFISAMRCAYQVIISRKLADEILSQHRDSLEQKMGSTTNSAGLGASTDVMGIGLSADVSTSQGTTETSFYKVDNTGSLGMSLSAGLEKYLSANIGFALSLTNSLVFYSLEQYLDTGMADGNIAFFKLTDDEIKKVIKSRKDMQDAESTMIPKMKNSIEHFLKSADIVPQKLMFAWPKSTSSSANEKSSEFKARSYIGGAASCLASLGLDVSAEASVKKTQTTHPYLELINENCEVTEYCKDVNDLANFLGVSKYKKFVEITNAIDVHTKSEDKNFDSEVTSMLVNNITGDLKRYNSNLTIMADSDISTFDKKNARVTKKDIEKDWIGSGIKSKAKRNRENMLKLAIALAAYLKSKSTDETDNELFTPLYNEIDHLSALQKFTNNIFVNPNNGFNTSRKSTSVAATGHSVLEIPLVGATEFSISYSESDSPLYTETSQDVTVKTQLPIIQGKIYGIEKLKEKLKEFIVSSSKKSDKASVMLADSLQLIDKKFDNILASYGIEKTISIPTVLSINNYMNMDFFLTNISPIDAPENSIPLPNSDLLTKDEDEMVLKLTKRIDNILTKLKLSDGKGDQVSTFKRTGNASSKIGSNTLSFIVNKFNACELGRKSTGVDSLWSKFTQSQKDSLNNMFINIDNDQSNVRYELQCLYSSVINSIDNKKDITEDQKLTLKQTVENVFEKFLDSCKKLSENSDNTANEELYNESEKLLSAILKINHEYVWLPALASANSL